MLFKTSFILQILLCIEVLLYLLLSDRIVKCLTLHLNTVLQFTIIRSSCWIWVSWLFRINCKFAKPHNMQTVISWNCVMLSWSSNCLPVIHILIVIKILTPLNQTVDILIKLVIINLHKLFVVKWVLVKCLKLLLKLNWFYCCWVQTFTLFLNYLCVLSISIEFTKPFDFLWSLLSCCLLLPDCSWIMKRFRFVFGLYISLISTS